MTKIWYNQKNDTDNLVITTKYLLSCLNINFTSELDTQLLSHPEYPSLKALNDVLNEYYIENISIKIDQKDLYEIPNPSVAQLEFGSKSYFAVIIKVENNQVTYIDSAQGFIQKPLEVFLKNWNGFIHLAMKTPYSGEYNFYNKKKESELIKVHKILFSLVLILISVVTILIFSQNLINNIIEFLIFSFIKLIGALICVFLFIKEFNEDSSGGLIDKICKLGTSSNNIDCNKVLNSKASKITSWLSTTDIGIFYFFGGLVSVLLGYISLASYNVLPILFYFNLLALPYTFFSIYYQIKIKSFCVLCISVQVLLWVEFLFFINLVNILPISIQLIDLYLSALGFLISILIWTVLKPLYRKKEALQRSYKHFTYLGHLLNYKIDLLEKKSIVSDTKRFSHEIILGNFDALNNIIIVLSPSCNYCKDAFLEILGLQSTFPEQLNVYLRFYVEDSPNLLTKLWLERIIELSANTENLDELIAFLKDWYLKIWPSKESVKSFVKERKKKLVKTNILPSSMIDQYKLWIKKNNISGTPTLIFNGYIINSAIPIRKLHHMIE